MIQLHKGKRVCVQNKLINNMYSLVPLLGKYKCMLRHSINLISLSKIELFLFASFHLAKFNFPLRRMWYFVKRKENSYDHLRI